MKTSREAAGLETHTPKWRFQPLLIREFTGTIITLLIVFPSHASVK
jgi:hypothetical protein